MMLLLLYFRNSERKLYRYGWKAYSSKCAGHRHHYGSERLGHEFGN